MTAPVAQSAADPGDGHGTVAGSLEETATASGTWRIRFFMPVGETIARLPRPANAAVVLVTVPAETVAVLRSAGRPTACAVREAGRRLLRDLAGTDLVADGVPFAWFYDPPWTIPALRRNETVVRVKAGRDPARSGPGGRRRPPRKTPRLSPNLRPVPLTDLWVGRRKTEKAASAPFACKSTE